MLNRCGGTRGYPLGKTPAARTSPPEWRRRGEGGSLGQWDWGSDNGGMEAICLLYVLYIQGIYKKNITWDVRFMGPSGEASVSFFLVSSWDPGNKR